MPPGLEAADDVDEGDMKKTPTFRARWQRAPRARVTLQLGLSRSQFASLAAVAFGKLVLTKLPVGFGAHRVGFAVGRIEFDRGGQVFNCLGVLTQTPMHLAACFQ